VLLYVKNTKHREDALNNVIGHNIKKARELTGLSQEQLAELLGVSRATLSAIENGHIAIDSGKLLATARALGRPVSDFFREEEEALALLYRAALEETAPPEARSAFERFCKSYWELEKIVGVADTQLPPPDYSTSPGAESRPDQFAAQVAASERQRLGLGERDPIVNVFQLLEEQGVRIFRYLLEHDSVFGVSAFSPKYGPCILLNSANTIERQIFSLAHEYGHLLMHRRFYQSADPASGLDKEHLMEIMANEFAANFLVPAAGLRDVFWRDIGQKDIGLGDLVFLKRYFKVSAQMLLRRLRDAGLVQKQHADSLAADLEKRAPARQEFVPLNEDVLRDWKLISRFKHLARKAALEGMVSLGKLAELMNRNVVDARRQVREWRKEVSFA
jgi:Zn-dependent peptidase ImmA (M78 family)/transcriptional regulator with XRE-family HTH domain